MRLSYSAISTYIKCPKVYYKQYIQKVEQKYNIYFDIGNRCHKIIERYLNNDFIDVSTLISENFSDKNKVNDRISYLLSDSVFTDVKKLCQKDNIIDYDTENSVTIDLTDDIQLKGIVDLQVETDDTIYITDWKTSRARGVSNYWYDEYQLKLYHHLVKTDLKTDKKIICQFYFLDGACLKSFEYDDKDIEKIIEKTKYIANRIKSETEYPEHPLDMWKCGYCEFNSECIQYDLKKQLGFLKKQ